MIPDDPFESIDRALSSGLSGLAPNVAGDDETLAVLRPRFRRACTRRRVVKAGGLLSALLVVGGVARLAAPQSQHTHVSVSSPSTTTPTPKKRTHKSATSTSTVPRTVPTSTPTTALTPTTTRPNRGVGSGPSIGPGSSVTFPPPVVTTVPSQGSGPGPSPTTGGGHSPGGPPSTTATTVPRPMWGAVANSKGGSITFNFAFGRLRLLDVSPKDGYYKDVFRASSREIDVRFLQGGEVRSRIDLQVKDGRLSGPTPSRTRISRSSYRSPNPTGGCGVFPPFVGSQNDRRPNVGSDT